jgi:PKD repeat protein
MDFSANVGSGGAPLTVVFTCMATQTVYKYQWNFGDGRTSTEKEPVHIYRMPGVYTVSLTIEDENGNTYTTTHANFIYVYNWEYGTGAGMHVADTTKCFRSAVRPLHGVGIVPYTGTYWIWPTAYTGTCRGFDDAGDTVSLVCHNRNGRFYRLGLQEQWTDRMDSYGGYEITGKFRLPERTAPIGEYVELEHVESHIHIRPWKESYRNASGYSSEGFRDNHAIHIQIYDDGEPTTPLAKLEDIDRYGDYVYRKRVEARRLQTEFLFETAAWRAVMVQEQYMPIDKKAGPEFDYPKEEQWQYEFRQPDLWISRDRMRPLYNRATGRAMTGTCDVLSTGPDGQSVSAVSMAVANTISTTLSAMSGDFTLSFWLKGIASFPATIMRFATGALFIRITQAAGVNSLVFTDGTNGFSRVLSYTSGWEHFAIVRSGNQILFYEGGTLIYNTPMIDSSIAYGGATIISNAAILSFFDVRRLNRAVSAAAIAYYIDDIENNGKQSAFLPVLR